MSRATRPRAAVFDAYGTLLDIHSAVARHAARVGDKAAAVSALWRAKQLEATWVLSATGAYEGFDAITDRALGFALATHGIADDTLRADLLRAYRSLDALPDAAAALARLRDAGLATAILSNGQPDALAAATRAAGIAPLLGGILSVHPLRRYKPHPAVYALVTERFACQPDEVAFASSNDWDAHGAARFGFRVFWINRARQPVTYWLDEMATILPDLAALPDAILG
ncbi:haloacid dehalogenase type II [Roseomonas sp. CCTCC AB2023176]|uniref:haloacid dehalogenase type II n=1 Tax=Roseomonas sp. CCTCC AB2023176 TaxID=3342640 RepID=UPI0035D820CE